MNWSEREVEAVVADYFAMLQLELAGEKINKTAFRNAVARKLDNRSAASIEWKRENISAVLIGLGFPYIEGYKPAFNYQRALIAAVLERLQAEPALQALVEAQVTAPAAPSAMASILGALVDPPTLRKAPPKAVTGIREFRDQAPRDYLAMEAANRSLGAAGEEFVLKFEIARLIKSKRERLAAKVEHTSSTRGDGAGFDILSFDESGKERLIEVKTTAYGAYIPFHVSRNELAVSQSH